MSIQLKKLVVVLSLFSLPLLVKAAPLVNNQKSNQIQTTESQMDHAIAMIKNLEYANAYNLLEKLARQDIAASYFPFAYMNYTGLGGTKDLVSARKWYKKAADIGDIKAMGLFASMLLSGEGGAQDFKTAREYFRLSAESGLPESQFHYAAMLLQGMGGDRNVEMSCHWGSKAAELGYPRAQLLMGIMLNGSLCGAPNYEKAYAWLSLAGKAGLSDAVTQQGKMHYLGYGVELNKEKGCELFKQVTHDENPENQYFYAMCFLDGTLPASEISPLKILRKSAEQGYVLAQAEMYRVLFTGDGVDKNQQESVEWLKKAADQGYGLAQYVLGRHCLTGQFINCSSEIIEALWQSAAQKGNLDAQNDLGEWYLQNHNPEKGLMYIQAAASSGHPKAKKSFALLLKQDQMNNERQNIQVDDGYLVSGNNRPNIDRYQLAEEARMERQRREYIYGFDSPQTSGVYSYTPDTRSNSDSWATQSSRSNYDNKWSTDNSWAFPK